MIMSKIPILRQFQGNFQGTARLSISHRRVWSLWFQELLQLLNSLVHAGEKAEAFSLNS